MDDNSCSAGATDVVTPEDLFALIRETLGKVDKLVEEVSSIKLVVRKNKDRLDVIQGASKVESEVGSDSAKKDQERQPKSKSKKEDKQSRVEAEKQRQLKLLIEKLKAKENSADEAQESSG